MIDKREGFRIQVNEYSTNKPGPHVLDMDRSIAGYAMCANCGQKFPVTNRMQWKIYREGKNVYCTHKSECKRAKRKTAERKRRKTRQLIEESRKQVELVKRAAQKSRKTDSSAGTRPKVRRATSGSR